jgi:hypothetical protein
LALGSKKPSFNCFSAVRFGCSFLLFADLGAAAAAAAAAAVADVGTASSVCCFFSCSFPLFVDLGAAAVAAAAAVVDVGTAGKF